MISCGLHILSFFLTLNYYGLTERQIPFSKRFVNELLFPFEKQKLETNRNSENVQLQKGKVQEINRILNDRKLENISFVLIKKDNEIFICKDLKLIDSLFCSDALAFRKENEVCGSQKNLLVNRSHVAEQGRFDFPMLSAKIIPDIPGDGRNIYISAGGGTDEYSQNTLRLTPRFFWINILILILSAMYLKQHNKFRKENQLLKEKIMLKEKNELRLQILNARMSPHFTFNVLNSLQGLVLKNDNFTSVAYLNKYAGFMRKVLSSSNTAMITLEDELNLVLRYIELENLRFNQGIRYNLDIDPSVCTSKCFIPGMLLQPIVENSVKHGFRNKVKPNLNLNLSVKLCQNCECIEIEISDDGIGYSNSLDRNTGHHDGSMGLNIVYERLRLLNEENGITDYYSIGDLVLNDNICGTIVRLKFPTTEGK